MEHLYRTIVCEHCGELIRIPIYCGDRFCPVCSPARTYRVQQKIKYLISKAQFTPGYFLGMITLSMPNCTDLAVGIPLLINNFKKLRHTKLWKRSVKGGLYVVEITGGIGSFHPHIHAIVEQKFISYKAFQSKWARISGATAFHVKKIPSGAAERYITKYITKPSLSPELLPRVAASLRHVRLFQAFGSWHGLVSAFVKPAWPCPICGKQCFTALDKLIADNPANRVVEQANKDPIPTNIQSFQAAAAAALQRDFGIYLIDNKGKKGADFGEYVVC